MLPRQVFHPRASFPIVRRLNSTSSSQSPSPDSPSAKVNPHRNFYRQFGRPIAKNFLIAVAVYQALYWSWLKLESIEFQREKHDEIRELEGELTRLTQKARKT